jgi:excisionase family DNA binding protein
LPRVSGASDCFTAHHDPSALPRTSRRGDSQPGEYEVNAASEIEPLLLDVEHTRAALGGVSRRTLYQWVKDEKLRAVKLGSRVMFDPADLRKFIDAAKDASR